MNRKLFAMLAAKQEAFCRAYADQPNGAEAARAAGYADSGAKQEASRLLARPEIAERVEALSLAAAERRARVAEELMTRLGALLDADLAVGARDGARDTIRLHAQVAGIIGARTRG